MHFPGRWVTWVILLLGLVFVAAGVSNLRTHEQTEAVACFALGGVLLALFPHQRRQGREERAFLAWLSANAAALRAGAGASYRDQLITVNTPTRQLTLC